MYVGSKYYLLAIIWFWLNNLFQWCLSIPSYESLFWVTDPCHSPKLLLPRPILASYQELALTSHYTGWWWLTLVIAWHKSLMSQHQLQVWLLISTLWASTEIIWEGLVWHCDTWPGHVSLSALKYWVICMQFREPGYVTCHSRGLRDSMINCAAL